MPRSPLAAAALLAAVAALTDTAAAEEAFVAGVVDLPLMAELAEVPGLSVVFDKPDGRIVEAAARGRVAASAVARFYDATLPQLGWVKTAPLRWTREGEVLALELVSEGSLLTVRYSISPR